MTRKKKDQLKLLILKTVAEDLTAHGGFQYPGIGGTVVAPDWSDTPICGTGLHGWLWGEGDVSLIRGESTAKWLLMEVDADTPMVHLNGKVKVPEAKVVGIWDRRDTAHAARYIVDHGGEGRTVIGRRWDRSEEDHVIAAVGPLGNAHVGGESIAAALKQGTATAFYGGIAVAQEGGIAIAEGQALAGKDGYAVAIDTEGHAIADEGGWAIALARNSVAVTGHSGIAIVGENGVAIGGINSNVAGGPGATLIVHYQDQRLHGAFDMRAVAVVGRNGIKPETMYEWRYDYDAKKVRWYELGETLYLGNLAKVIRVMEEHGVPDTLVADLRYQAHGQLTALGCLAETEDAETE
jgi:hypothetical protein